MGKVSFVRRAPIRSRVQTIGEREWSPKAARPGVVGEGEYTEGDGEQTNAISTYPYVTGAGQNTLRRLALFLYVNHPTTIDVRSGQKPARRSFLRSSKVKFRSSVLFSYL